MQGTLRFISGAEYQDNQERIDALLSYAFTYSANLLQVIADGQRYGLVSEFVPGQTLADMQMVAGGIRPLLARQIAASLRVAIDELHAAGIAHGDISPANIVVDQSASGGLRLIDFATLTAGTPGFQGEAESSDFARDILAAQEICTQLGVDFPEDAGEAQDNQPAQALNLPLEPEQIDPAAMLRADLMREETQQIQLKRSRCKKTPQASLRTGYIWTLIRKTLGSLALIGGAIMLAWWLRQTPSGNMEIARIEKPELITTNEVAPAAVCPSAPEAEAVLRQLLQIRNQALMDLDVSRLSEVYAPGSGPLSLDEKLFALLHDNAVTVTGISSEITAVEVKQCDTQVRVAFSHRLLEHQRCQAGECLVIPAGQARIEEIVLNTTPWRIAEINIHP